MAGNGFQNIYVSCSIRQISQLLFYKYLMVVFMGQHKTDSVDPHNAYTVPGIHGFCGIKTRQTLVDKKIFDATCQLL